MVVFNMTAGKVMHERRGGADAATESGERMPCEIETLEGLHAPGRFDHSCTSPTSISCE
jgi:hypothetical protein